MVKGDGKIELHLISAPWPLSNQPSPQIGALKSYLDSIKKLKVPCYVYHAYLYVYLQFNSWTGKSIGQNNSVCRELYYLYLLMSEFNGGNPLGENGRRIIQLLNSLSSQVDENDLKILRGVTRTYIKKEILPNINKNKINIIGFSLVYDQLYSSIYFIKTIESLLPEQKFIYVFGGSTIANIDAIKMLNKFNITGWGIIGQGEKKIEYFLREVIYKMERGLTNSTESFIFSKETGIFPLETPPKDIDRLSAKYFLNEISFRDEMTIPNYTNYYEILSQCGASGFVEDFLGQHEFPLEISRGCTGECDFCNKRMQSVKYRCMSSHKIGSHCLGAIEKYKVHFVLFTDPVCEWALDFAKYLLKRNVDIKYFQELRVGWTEEEYSLMSMAGLTAVQFGIESFSQRLLDAMNKQTTVIENLKSLKYAAELGINSRSNIITFHPKSTIQDVVATRDILEKISHFPKINLSRFTFSTNSKIYRELSVTIRNKLYASSFATEKGAYPLAYDYLLPEEHMPNKWEKVRREWASFEKWYSSVDPNKNYLTATNIDKGKILIEYGINEKFQKKVYEGDCARIINEAHGGVTMEEISGNLKINPIITKKILQKLEREKILLKVEGRYLTIALRARNVLLRNLLGRMVGK